jgi:hypothetical protein
VHEDYKTILWRMLPELSPYANYVNLFVGDIWGFHGVVIEGRCLLVHDAA